MRDRRHRFTFTGPLGQAYLLILLLALPARLDAYIDPGSGSMLLQVLVGGLLAASAALRFYWKRIGAWIRRDSDEKP